MNLKYTVINISKYENVKQVLKNEFSLSDRLISKLKRNKQISLNNITASVNEKIKFGDIISVNLDFEETCSNIIPSQMDLDILYEDDGLLIINKQPFIPVHPSMDHFDDSLSNGVKYYFDSINLKRKIRPVNRLDKNTSGIVIFSKNEYIQECLIKQMKSSDFKKEYLAITNGIFAKNFQVISAPIARKDNSIIERCISPNGNKAITEISLLKNFNTYALVKCNLKTGRTHQIRVHLSHIGHSILGDDLYGQKSNLIDRQALHAYKINFIHPISKINIEIVAPIPNDIKKLL